MPAYDFVLYLTFLSRSAGLVSGVLTSNLWHPAKELDVSKQAIAAIVV